MSEEKYKLLSRKWKEEQSMQDGIALSKTNTKKQRANSLPLSSIGRTKRVVLLHGNDTITTTTSWLSSSKLRTVDRPAMPVSSPVSVVCVSFICETNISRCCCLLCDDLFSLLFFPRLLRMFLDRFCGTLVRMPHFTVRVRW